MNRIDRLILRVLSHPAAPWLAGAVLGLAAGLVFWLGGVPDGFPEVRP